MLAGVCGGIGEYFNIDPVIVRLLVVAFTLAGGAGLIAYIIGAIIIPEVESGRSNAYQETYHEDSVSGEDKEGNTHQEHRGLSKNSGRMFGLILILLGGFVILRHIVPWIPEESILAVILVVLGIYLLIRNGK